MKNTEENAQEFYMNAMSGRYAEPSVFEAAQIMVAYASALTPPVPDQTVRVPKAEWIDQFNLSHRSGILICIEQIKSLNPSAKFETI